MKFKTHLAFTFLLFFVIDYLVGLTVLEGALLFILSFIPDIDLHTSYIGKRTRPLSNIIQLLFQHRGFFHSLWIPIIFYLVLSPYGLELAVFGYLGHLLLDLLNPKGLCIFWPFFRIKGFIRGEIADFVLFLVFLVFDLMFILIKILVYF